MNSEAGVLFDIRRIYQDARWVFIASFVSMGLSFLLVELTHLVDLQSRTNAYLLLGLFLVGYCAPMILVVLAVRHSFRHGTKGTLISTIMACYLCLIMTFAALYYAMAAVGQMLEFEREYDYYAEKKAELESGRIELVLPRDTQDRQFVGIESRIYSGLRQNMPLEISPDSIDPPVEYFLAATSAPRDEVIRFEPGARLPLFLECFHLSVATMTTLGYGDVHPDTWWTRLACDIQVLTAVMLTVLGLGMVFGNWWQKE